MAFGDYGLYYKLPRHVWIPAIIVGGLLTLAAAAKMGTAKSCQCSSTSWDYCILF